jgi:predicted O-methyltransferase YrrM
LNDGGIVICDNLLFHGLVSDKEQIESKRLKGLVNKIDDFNHKLIEHPDFDSFIYEIGDGLSMSIKKG